MTENKAKEVGNKVIEILGLKLVDGKVQTAHGPKTPKGIGYMVEDMVNYPTTFESRER